MEDAIGELTDERMEGMNEEGRISRGGKITIGSVLLLIVAGFVFLCLVSFVVIAILALLGPQIGNVFSQINSGLQTTPLP